MTAQEGSWAGTAPGAVGAGTAAVGVGADRQGHHFRKSPTLLFDILAEPDKDKQQQKLKRASLSAASRYQHQQETQPQQRQQHPATQGRQQQPQQQQQPEQQQGDVATCPAASNGSPPLGPATPDLLSERTTGCTTVAAIDGSLGLPVVSESTVSAFTREGGDAAAAARDPRVNGLQHQERQQQQQQPGTGPDREAATAPNAEEADARETEGEAGQATATEATAVCLDPLAEFTPRVILRELLGELFIPPERLKRQGSFGQGAFATVESCSLEDPDGGPNLLVAVKSLKPEVLSDMEDLRRFLLEANLVRKLRHPNIVSIHGLGAHNLASIDALRSSAYVVMEALEGGDLRMMVLRQMTSRSPAYSRLDALRWCLHIAAACAYLHETCRPMVIHRDLKPENVMLTGGPTDSRIAKITDFGLHKRARYSRAEDVLIAVTSEWSTHGGSVYRGGAGGTVRGGGGGGGRPDTSTYGGSVIEASYYGGNAYADALGSGPSLHRGPGGSVSAHYLVMGGPGAAAANANRSTSAHYAALAAAGMAAATAAPPPPPPPMAATTAAGRGDGFAEVLTAGMASDSSNNGGGSGGSVGRAGSVGPGDSLRAGSEAAAELGLQPNGGGGGGRAGVTERERPYLLAYDKRYDALPPGSKFGSTQDLTALHDAAAATAAAAGGVLAAANDAAGASPFAGSGQQEQPPQHPGSSTAPTLHSATLAQRAAVATQPPGWSPPNVVPASLEESVHRKMLALMALESAAASAAPMTSGADVTAADAANAVGAAAAAASNGGGAAAALAAAPPTPTPAFSVTEFVRAAATVPMEGVGPTGPSAVMLMRSISLALQQQQKEQQQQAGGVGGGGGICPLPEGGPAAAPAPPPLAAPFGFHQPGSRAARAASAAMKTVPENNRMSMDLHSVANQTSQRSDRGTRGGASASGSGSGSGSGGGGDASASGRQSDPPSSAAARRMTEAASQRDKAAAAARMADATRQVGSLIYMAPELVLSGNYNEKVDVFSFAIIAYELFMGKLLAMKVANEYACQQMRSRGGPGGLPTGGTRSADEQAEAGVMSYVMRRSKGAREALPSWWPAPLRQLVGRCWAQDPAERPSFSQIHRELRRMQQEGTLADMDSRDPLRDMGCGCTIC